VIKGWAEEGIEKGFGEGKMHYLDDETDESGGGGFEWNEDEHWVEFFVDMGSANDEALEALYSKFSSFNQIKEVKIGSGYEWLIGFTSNNSLLEIASFGILLASWRWFVKNNHV
jgi:hypothetical protein